MGHQRSRSKGVAKLAIYVLIGYYTLYFGGVGMAKKDQLDAMIAVFTPTIIVGSIALYMFKKSKWLA